MSHNIPDYYSARTVQETQRKVQGSQSCTQDQRIPHKMWTTSRAWN